MSGDLPVVDITHLDQLVQSHSTGLTDLVRDDVGRTGGDAMTLHDHTCRVVVAVVAVVEGDRHDAGVRGGDEPHVAEPDPARDRPGGRVDAYPHAGDAGERGASGDAACAGAVDGHSAPRTGAQSAHVRGGVEADVVVVVLTEFEPDPVDLTIILGSKPEVPLGVGHIGARQSEIREGRAGGVAGGAERQRLRPTCVSARVGLDRARPGGQDPCFGILHVGHHRLPLP